MPKVKGESGTLSDAFQTVERVPCSLSVGPLDGLGKVKIIIIIIIKKWDGLNSATTLKESYR
jgi:hypothetical protein